MTNFTSKTYQMKREILTFSTNFSRRLPKPEKKFMADINYGILASGSCLLTDVVHQLHEPSKKINGVDRLSRHLAKGIPKNALNAYLAHIKKWCPAHPVIHIDDSDMILSILVDTFFSRISLTMLPVPNLHNTSCVLS